MSCCIFVFFFVYYFVFLLSLYVSCNIILKHERKVTYVNHQNNLISLFHSFFCFKITHISTLHYPSSPSLPSLIPHTVSVLKLMTLPCTLHRRSSREVILGNGYKPLNTIWIQFPTNSSCTAEKELQGSKKSYFCVKK